MKAPVTIELLVSLTLLMGAGALTSSTAQNNIGGTGLASRFFPKHSRKTAPFANDRFTHLRGQEVENSDGTDVGNLAEVFLDMQTGAAKYALVRSRGLLGVGTRSKAVPADRLSAATAKKGVLALDVSNRDWDKAPEVPSTFRRLDMGALARLVDDYYRRPQTRQTNQLAPAGRPGSGRNLRSNQVELKSSSALLGAQVVNRKSEVMGKVSDLLVDFSGEKPVIALISASNRRGPEGTFGIAVERLNGVRSGRLVIDANHIAFANAPALTPELWREAGSAGAPFLYRIAEH